MSDHERIEAIAAMDIPAAAKVSNVRYPNDNIRATLNERGLQFFHKDGTPYE